MGENDNLESGIWSNRDLTNPEIIKMTFKDLYDVAVTANGLDYSSLAMFRDILLHDLKLSEIAIYEFEKSGFDNSITSKIHPGAMADSLMKG